MSVTVRVTVEDIADKILTYTGIRLEVASSVDGSYSEVSTESLVADTVYYEIEDPSGTLSKWYRYRFAGTSPSDYTNPFRPDGIDRQKLRQEALQTYDAGLVVTAASAGQTTTVLAFDDYRLQSSGYGAGRAVGSIAYIVDGTNAGEARLIVSSAVNTGLYTVSPALPSALGEGDQVEIHWLTDINKWNLAINRALQRYKVIERVPVVGEDSDEISLSYLGWLKSRGQICGIWYYPSEFIGETAYGVAGTWWNARQDAGSVTLQLRPALNSNTTVYLEALKPLDSLYTDDSVLPDIADLDLAAALAYDEVLKSLLLTSITGKAMERIGWRQARTDLMPRLRRLWTENGPRPRWQKPPTEYPHTISAPWSAR